METVHQSQKESEPKSCGPRASNNNRRSHPLAGRSLFPENATARILKPSCSVMTSANAPTKEWRLVFDRCSAPFIEPLPGYTGSGETLVQVELKFPTLESAIRYAERQGLDYFLQRQADTGAQLSPRLVKPGREGGRRGHDLPEQKAA
ncbi:NADH dehydrogenase ubiquinone Fe-S domain-containing protein [Rhizobium etli bv. phaseoli str. IE4803]|nr:NADH dehydrogenase ubiquinone Fe-S domain-containing protein [Rhizobium etli bv. phaseoli str. IE4803]